MVAGMMWGIGLNIAWLIWHIMRPQCWVLERDDQNHWRQSEHPLSPDDVGASHRVVRVDGRLIFLNAEYFRRFLK